MNTTRQTIITIAIQLLVGSMLATLSFVAPAAYVAIMAVMAAILVIAATLALGFWMMRDGSFFGVYFGMRTIEGGFELAGCLIGALLGSSD